MECKVRIREIAVYHPENQVNNEHYIEHFRKQGKDVNFMLTNILGRENRYLIKNEGKEKEECENSLTLQIQAAKRVLEKSQLTGEDIDGIIVATQFPEYMIPPSFMRIHEAIGGKRDCFGYDINVNCLGMTMAFQQASQYLACNKNINRILVVAGDYMNLGASKDDENLYGALGEAACAIIVERTEEDCGLVDKDYFINNASINGTIFPKHGMSEIFDKCDMDFMAHQDEKPECDIPIVIEKMQALLEKNNLTVNDISGFCFSQYVKANNMKIMEALGIGEEKCPFVGDIYAYTGGCSPFLALNKLVEEEKIKRGDFVLFWTIGSAMQHIFILMKY